MPDQTCTCSADHHAWSCPLANPLADIRAIARREAPLPTTFYLPRRLYDEAQSLGMDLRDVEPIEDLREEDSEPAAVCSDPLVPQWVMDAIEKDERARLARSQGFVRALEDAAARAVETPGGFVSWQVIPGGKHGPLNP